MAISLFEDGGFLIDSFTEPSQSSNKFLPYLFFEFMMKIKFEIYFLDKLCAQLCVCNINLGSAGMTETLVCVCIVPAVGFR